MRNGFISIPTSWLLAGVAGIALLAYFWHCESEKKKSATFVAQVEAKGLAAEQEASDAIKENLANKERTDAETTRLRTLNASLSRSLHDARASSGFLPTPAPGAPGSDRITLDRALLERAIRQLDERVSELIAEGDQAVVGLDAAKAWAKGISVVE